MAVKYLLDEHLPYALFAGLKRRDPAIDVVRVQQSGLRGAEDPEVLALAAEESRIVVSKDKATLRDFAGARIQRGEGMAGLLVIRRSFLRGNAGLGTIIDELVNISQKTESRDWDNVIRFIPSADKFPPA